MKNKIKELLPNDEILSENRDSKEREQICELFGVDDAMSLKFAVDFATETRNIIAQRYAEKYSVTWEQLVDHCVETYLDDVDVFPDRIELMIGDFYKSGKVELNETGLERETWILWGRYLEGLSDENK